MKLRIKYFEVEISEPYKGGQKIGPLEARELNARRGGLIRRKLEKIVDTGAGEAWLAAQAARIDREFQWGRKAPSKWPPLPGGLDQELGRMLVGEMPQDLSGAERDQWLALRGQDPKLRSAAMRRLLARQTIANEALEALARSNPIEDPLV